MHGEIDGHRQGRSVSFTKFYNHQRVRHSIRYEGSADENLARIEGRWTVSADWSGTFFMTRDDLGESAAAEERAEEVISRRA